MLKQDFTIIKGETFIKDIYVTVNNEIYPLPQYIALSEIRPYAGSEDLIESINCEVYSEEGRIHLELSSEQTNDLPKGILYYDVLLINTETDEHTYYIGGKLIIKNHVTELPT